MISIDQTTEAKQTGKVVKRIFIYLTAWWNIPCVIKASADWGVDEPKL